MHAEQSSVLFLEPYSSLLVHTPCHLPCTTLTGGSDAPCEQLRNIAGMSAQPCQNLMIRCSVYARRQPLPVHLFNGSCAVDMPSSGPRRLYRHAWTCPRCRARQSSRTARAPACSLASPWPPPRAAPGTPVVVCKLQLSQLLLH